MKSRDLLGGGGGGVEISLVSSRQKTEVSA